MITININALLTLFMRDEQAKSRDTIKENNEKISSKWIRLRRASIEISFYINSQNRGTTDYRQWSEV
jgi:hypothetical protein